VYGAGPQCNTRGLTDLGAYVIKQMIRQGVLIQLDHMDSKTADAALSIAEGQRYSGVISAHCCSSQQLFRRIYATGGAITPPVMPASGFAAQLKHDKALMIPRYEFGSGWGSDLNGLGDQPGPDATNPIRYPFQSFDGRVTFNREQWGQRVFDLNTDGLANYGMYADWLQQVQQIGGRQVMTDLMNGAEAYLETWERAAGVPSTACRPSGGAFDARGNTGLSLGSDFKSLLFALGQPSSRPGSSYRYCVAGSPRAMLSAVFTSASRVGMWATNAPGYAAGGITPGQPARRLHGRATRIAARLWISRRLPGGRRYAYGVRGGRISFVALAGKTFAGRRSALRSALRASGVG
jgi:hypothetical protein